MIKKYSLLIFVFLIFLFFFIFLIRLRQNNPPAPKILSPSSLTTIKKSSGEYAYENTTNNFKTYFKDSPIKESSIVFNNKISQISFYTPQNQSFGNLNSSQASVENNVIFYRNVYSHTDLKYTILSSRLLEEFLVDNSNIAVSLSPISQIVATQNIDRYENNPDGSITFFYQNQAQFVIPKPVLYEYGHQENKNYGIKYDVVSTGQNSYKISKVITDEGRQWLQNPQRNYPIAIDLVIDNADIISNWASSDTANLSIFQDTNNVYEGSGSVRIASAGTLGSGADGAITISAATNINTTAIASGRTCADAINYSVLSLGTSSAVLTSSIGANCFAVGDEILLINLQGTTASYTNVGNYETLQIQSVGTSSVVFTSTKNKYYGNNSTDDTNIGTGTNNQKVMLQRVPNYTTVTVNSGYTLTGSNWNGIKGGIIFFRASGTVTVSGSISATGIGYTGGPGTDTWTSYQGEGIPGYGIISANANVGGGGGGLYNGGAGAGGGYGTNGTTQGSSIGGNTYGSADLSKLYLGSGGGGGGWSYSTGCACYTAHGPGGRGGGIIVINANSIGVTGTIVSGTAGASDNGGAGSGGSIMLNANSIAIGSSLVTAIGGGSGRIRLNYRDSLSGSTNPTASTSPDFHTLDDTVYINLTKPLDFSYSSHNELRFWVKSSHTGQLVRFQFGESNNNEQTYDITINSANTWEEKVWDLFSINTASRDLVSKLAFKITSDTSPLNFNFDDIFIKKANMSSNCLLKKSNDNSSIAITWNDLATDEDGYAIQRKVDGASYSLLTTLSSGTTAYTDSTVSSGHTYQYEISPYYTGPIYSDWCETSSLSLQNGSIKYEGIIFQ
jgi:hypothetical protein